MVEMIEWRDTESIRSLVFHCVIRVRGRGESKYSYGTEVTYFFRGRSPKNVSHFWTIRVRIHVCRYIRTCTSTEYKYGYGYQIQIHFTFISALFRASGTERASAIPDYSATNFI